MLSGKWFLHRYLRQPHGPPAGAPSLPLAGDGPSERVVHPDDVVFFERGQELTDGNPFIDELKRSLGVPSIETSPPGATLVVSHVDRDRGIVTLSPLPPKRFGVELENPMEDAVANATTANRVRWSG